MTLGAGLRFVTFPVHLRTGSTLVSPLEVYLRTSSITLPSLGSDFGATSSLDPHQFGRR